MKKLFLLLTILGMVAVGCTGPEGEDVPGNEDVPGGEDYLTFINNTNINPTMVAGGGMVNITFTTEYDWTITTNVDWLSTSETNGFGGTVDFFITASANKTDKERKGIVTITLDEVDKEYKIRVTQAPNEGIKHLVCQANEILYTTKYNYVIEKDFADMTGFGDTDATYCVDYGYDGTYGYIRFNNDVTKIPDNAFAGCTSVEAIYLPDGVKEVGIGAFGGCTALHSIYSINSIDNYKALVIDGTLLAVAPAELTEYTIPSGVTKIGAGAFSGCKTLKKVIIPEGVKEIEAGAFNDCEKLEYLEIPNSLTIFGGDILTGKCNDNIELVIPSTHPNLLKYTTTDNKPVNLYSYENVIAEWFDGGVGYIFNAENLKIANNLFRNCSTLKSVTIGNSVTSIGEGAFYECNSLKNITIPDSVTSIGSSAFYKCTSLTSITIPDSVTSIGSSAFYKCTSLTSITIPNSVTSIGSDAFYSCDSLTSVTIGNSVTSIGNDAFRSCSSLTSVTIPNSVTEIGNYAFYNCSSLTSVTIPNSVTEIRRYAFYGCTSLKSVTIGNSVTSIGYYAFYNCSSLKEVYCKPTTPPAGDSNMFGSNASGRKIYVPRASVNAYESASYWSNYSNSIYGYDF